MFWTRPNPTKIKARWQVLNKDLPLLEKIKKTEPKKFNSIQIQLRDLDHDIKQETLRNLDLADSDRVELQKIKKKCKEYQMLVGNA